jgi:predicted DCC family thiol-disulfide oxidoreductase YuxK
MDKNNDKITVYYDGACPACVQDRNNYEKISGKGAGQICWFDITGQENQLRKLDIDPQKALTELHVSDESGQVMSELDAYILLMSKVPLLKPVTNLLLVCH